MSQSHAVKLVRAEEPPETLMIGVGETVLEGARRRGVIVPAGCISGTCGTCAGRLLEADGVGPSDDPELAVEYRRPPGALREEHRRQGYLLLCLVEPRTDCTIAVGAATRSSDLVFPWS